jgi:hypothetical protein
VSRLQARVVEVTSPERGANHLPCARRL